MPKLAAARHLFVIGARRGPGHRAGSRVEAEGDLRPACRGVQQRGSAPRPAGAAAGADFPALLFAQNDETRAGLEALAARPGRARRRRDDRGRDGAGRHWCCRRSPRTRRSQPLLHRAELLPPGQRGGDRARLRSRPARRTCARSPRRSDGRGARRTAASCSTMASSRAARCWSRAGASLAIVAPTDARCAPRKRRDLKGALLLPGFVDVQVNGGGGVLFNDDPSVETIRTIGARAPALRHHELPAHADQRRPLGDRRARSPRCATRSRRSVPGRDRRAHRGPVPERGAQGRARSRPSSATSTRDGVALLSSLERRAHAGDARARGDDARDHRAARARRRGGLGGPHQRDLSREMRAALDHGVTRLHAPLQRDVAAHAPRARRRGRGAARPRQLVRHHRRRTPRGPGGAADRAALQAPRPLHAGHRRDAQRRRRRATGSCCRASSISVRDGVCVDENGMLSGSALDMASAVRNTVDMLGVDARPRRCAWRAPIRREFLGLGNELGRIAPGYRANLVAADARLTIHETWIDGRASRE